MSLKMNMDKECGRCGKTTTVEVNMEGAKAQIDLEAAIDSNIAKLEDFVSAELDVAQCPELLIIHRYGKQNDKFTVETLSDLCTNADNAKRNRGCHARVKSLLDEVFSRVERPVKRNAKKEKAAPPNEKPKKD